MARAGESYDDDDDDDNVKEEEEEEEGEEEGEMKHLVKGKSWWKCVQSNTSTMSSRQRWEARR